MSGYNSVLHFLDITGKTKKPVEQTYKATQNQTTVRVDSTTQEETAKKEWSDFLCQCNESALQANFPALVENGRFSVVGIGTFINALYEDVLKMTKSRNYYKDRFEALTKKYNELYAYMQATKQDEAYAKWKDQQKQGRPRKTIDWERYDLLAQANVSQRDIAYLLEVSPNTLRKLLKER